MVLPNLIITGPIRPNIDYVNNMILYFKTLIKYDSKVFLGYWKMKTTIIQIK